MCIINDTQIVQLLIRHGHQSAHMNTYIQYVYQQYTDNV